MVGIDTFIDNSKNWRYVYNFIEAIRAIDIIYEHFDSISGICIKYLNKSKNFQIEQSSIRCYARLVKLSQNTEEKRNMFSFIETEFLKSSVYYKKRLYIYFFDELCQYFSFQFLIDHKVISNMLSIISDNKMFSAKIVDIFSHYIPVIESLNTKDKDEIYAKLKLLKNNRKLDKETNLVINIILIKYLYNQYTNFFSLVKTFGRKRIIVHPISKRVRR